MISTNSLDLLASEARLSNTIILRNFLPAAWFEKSDPCQLQAWLTIFQKAGFCQYTEGLRHDLGIERETRAGVGTFIKVGDRPLFVGSDDNGFFTWDFPAYAIWQNTSTISTFLRHIIGPAPIHKDWAFGYHSGLAEFLIDLEQRGLFLEVLLPFGGRYLTPCKH